MQDRTEHTLARPSRGDEAAYRRALAADPCAYCGGPATTLDHLVPRSRGGGNGWANLAVCDGCNARKHALSLLGFLGYRRLRDEQPKSIDAMVRDVLALDAVALVDVWDRVRITAWRAVGA